MSMRCSASRMPVEALTYEEGRHRLGKRHPMACPERLGGPHHLTGRTETAKQSPGLGQSRRPRSVASWWPPGAICRSVASRLKVREYCGWDPPSVAYPDSVG